MGKIVKVTMHDVAREVGLSQSTVSLALRNHPRIPAKTRSKVAAAADRLGYTPHAAVSALMAGIRSQRPVEQQATIGIITKHDSTRKPRDRPVFQANWQGAQRRARQLGYGLEEFSLNAPGMSDQRLGQILRARHIEALVVFPFRPPDRLELDWEQFAAVGVGYNLEAPVLNRVSANQYASMRTVVETLQARGYARPGLVVDRGLNERAERRWLSAFCGFAFESPAFGRDAVLLLERKSREDFQRWFKHYQPDVVIGCGILPIRSWLDALGVEVPTAVGLVGATDSFFYEQACAHIDENQELVGAAAVDLVVAQLHRNERGVPQHPVELFIPGRWMEGTTLRPAPTATPGERAELTVTATK